MMSHTARQEDTTKEKKAEKDKKEDKEGRGRGSEGEGGTGDRRRERWDVYYWEQRSQRCQGIWLLLAPPSGDSVDGWTD